MALVPVSSVKRGDEIQCADLKFRKVVSVVKGSRFVTITHKKGSHRFPLGAVVEVQS